jgi:hypothetical protein
MSIRPAGPCEGGGTAPQVIDPWRRNLTAPRTASRDFAIAPPAHPQGSPLGRLVDRAIYVLAGACLGGALVLYFAERLGVCA